MTVALPVWPKTTNQNEKKKKKYPENSFLGFYLTGEGDNETKRTWKTAEMRLLIFTPLGLVNISNDDHFRLVRKSWWVILGKTRPKHLDCKKETNFHRCSRLYITRTQVHLPQSSC